MTSPIGTVGSTTPTGTVGTTVDRTDSTADDKDMFLKLLLAQMKYQDPDKPVDSTSFLSQMASFTQVEQLTTLATTSASLLGSNQLQSAMSMVGKSVNYGVGDTAGSGTVTGVTIVDSVPELLIGTTKVALADVTQVTTVPPATAAATDAATTP